MMLQRWTDAATLIAIVSVTPQTVVGPFELKSAAFLRRDGFVEDILGIHTVGLAEGDLTGGTPGFLVMSVHFPRRALRAE
jgi:hypothetical protein